MARRFRQDRGLESYTLVDGQVQWRIRLWHNGKAEKFSGFKTKTEARNFYNDAKRNQRLDRFFPEEFQRGGSEPVSVVIDRYMGKQTQKKALKDERRYAAWWKQWYDAKRMVHVTTGSIEDARGALVQGGRLEQRTAATINRYVAWLKHVLNGEVRAGRLRRNPCTRLDPPKLRESRPDAVQLQIEQENRLKHVLGAEDYKTARLAMLTGLRQSEQFGLRWSWIDFELNVIRLPETKAGKPQIVVLVDEAVEILRSYDTWRYSLWVYPHPKRPDRSQNGQHYYNRVFLPALKTAGIPAGRRNNGVVWHSLRHTFGTRLALAGANDREIMDSGRWTSSAMVKNYVHLAHEHLRQLMEKAADYGRNPKATDGGEPQ